MSIIKEKRAERARAVPYGVTQGRPLEGMTIEQRPGELRVSLYIEHWVRDKGTLIGLEICIPF